jgi:hypothetical protein
VRAKTPRVDYALGNAFVIEVKNLLTEVEILQCGRAARSHFEGVLIIGDRRALSRRQDWYLRASGLVDLSSFSAQDVFWVLMFLCFHRSPRPQLCERQCPNR